MPCGQPLAYPAGISTLASVWQNLTASAIEDFHDSRKQGSSEMEQGACR